MGGREGEGVRGRGGGRKRGWWEEGLVGREVGGKRGWGKRGWGTGVYIEGEGLNMANGRGILVE